MGMVSSDEVLRQLDDLARRRPGGASRADFTAWATSGERLFVQLLLPTDAGLKRYVVAVENYIGQGGDLHRAVETVVGTFEACRRAVKETPPEVIEARLTAVGGAALAEPQGSTAPPTGIRLFISHSSADEGLAKLVIKLIRSALDVPPDAIRCTTVDGYGLPGGADTDEEIRAEVRGADVVLGIISVASLGSLYVAFELGARWGVEKDLIPLMAPGVDPSSIKGPLGGKNALRAERGAHLHDLVAKLGRILRLTPREPKVYDAELRAVESFPKAEALRAHATAQGPPALPAGMDLRNGVIWDARVSPGVPYCAGCRTGDDKWVPLSFQERPTGSTVFACPHGHPDVPSGSPEGGRTRLSAGILAQGGAGGGHGIHVEGDVKFLSAPPQPSSPLTLNAEQLERLVRDALRSEAVTCESVRAERSENPTPGWAVYWTSGLRNGKLSFVDELLTPEQLVINPLPVLVRDAVRTQLGFIRSR